MCQVFEAVVFYLTPNYIINRANGRSTDGAATKWTMLTSPSLGPSNLAGIGEQHI